MKPIIKLARVDERLLHATVALNWNRFITVDEFVTVDSEYVRDLFIEQIVKLSMPGQKVKILDVLGFINYSETIFEDDNHRAMVIFKDVHTLRLCVENGFQIKEVQFQAQSNKLKNHGISSWLTERDKVDFAYLYTKNVLTYFQTSPFDEKSYFNVMTTDKMNL